MPKSDNMGHSLGMIEIAFRGRLGNQLFQYAYATTLAAKLGCRLGADFGWYFRAPEPFELWRFEKTGLSPVTRMSEAIGRVAEKLRFLRPLREYEMYETRFDPAALQVGDGVRLNGWFQSVRYFESRADQVRALYDLSPFTPQADMAALRAAADGRPLVALHVRRGDYVNNPHFFLDDYEEYYRRALDHMAAVLGTQPFIVVLSDDPAWCRDWTLLKGFRHEVFAASGPSDAFTDLAVMAACDHNIITNSSFSWWGAWLGDPAQRRVVMPKRWLPTRTTLECDMDVPGWNLI